MPGCSGPGPVDLFYTDHFTDAELAAAASRPDPKESLCGIWSAKEAIRKSHPDLAALSYREIEIAWGNDGRPVARLARPPSLEINLSISHSGAYALASAVVSSR
jgi:phosphopantetheine--protein transferase-like protein